MKTAYLPIILVSLMAFLVFAPIVPLRHSEPPTLNPNDYPWPDFFGSVTWSLFQCGTAVNGVGIIKLNCSPQS